MLHAGLAVGGGGGLAHLILRLFIWHAIWRFGLLIWRVPTVGPGLLVLIVLALLALAIFRVRRGRGRLGPRWPGPGRPGRGAGNPFGERSGDQAGPRDW